MPAPVLRGWQANAGRTQVDVAAVLGLMQQQSLSSP